MRTYRHNFTVYGCPKVVAEHMERLNMYLQDFVPHQYVEARAESKLLEGYLSSPAAPLSHSELVQAETILYSELNAMSREAGHFSYFTDFRVEFDPRVEEVDE